VTGTARIVVTLIVFATMLVLVFVRPRRWNEAWWTTLGAAAMLLLGLVSPREAIGGTLAGKNALLFLLSLLALSLLVGKSGFFDWAAIRCARIAKGNAHSLYRNAFVLGAIVTAILSLDTTAVMLTPVMLAVLKKIKLPAAPYIVLCAFVAKRRVAGAPDQQSHQYSLRGCLSPDVRSVRVENDRPAACRTHHHIRYSALALSSGTPELL
jgi:Na+/H+ antiporter NhaD/arsenite permease-like protein